MTDEINHADRDRRLLADAVLSELQQLAKLLEVVPILDVNEIAQRMAMKPSDLRRIFKRMGIKRT